MAIFKGKQAPTKPEKKMPPKATVVAAPVPASAVAVPPPKPVAPPPPPSVNPSGITEIEIFCAVLSGAISKHGMTNSEGQFNVAMVRDARDFAKKAMGEM